MRGKHLLMTAVAPILIMFMVGSLLFFLLDVFYAGSYEIRLRYILSLFVIAIVLIARISIEEGRAYASTFAVALGFVTWLAIGRLVTLGGPLAAYSSLINIPLLAFVWWAADRLTFDCTLPDTSRRPSGEGLLLTLGIEQENELPPASKPASETASETESEAAVAEPLPDLFELLFKHNRLKHRPGMWVLYFSLGALPLFGIGQSFAHQASLDTRRAMFHFLAIYVAASLALLCLTSLHTLENYLAQRKAKLSNRLSVSYLTAGVGAIIVLLAFCFMLPRPSPEYTITQFAPANTKDRAASRNAVGNDGNLQGENPKTSNQGKKLGQGAQKKSPQEEAAESEKGDKKAASSKHSPDSKKQPDDKPPENEDSGDEPKKKMADQPPQKRVSENEQKEKSKDDEQAKQSSKPAGNPSGSGLGRFAAGLFKALTYLLKAAYYILIIALVGWLIWRYQDKCKAFLAQLRDFWRRFWAELFGPKPVAGDAAVTAPAPPAPAPFADFPNPFLSGAADKMKLEDLVRFSFEALEAWGRERQCPRDGQTTPQEYAQQLLSVAKPIYDDARNLAVVYSQMAYAPATVNPSCREYIEKFWVKIDSL